MLLKFIQKIISMLCVLLLSNFWLKADPTDYNQKINALAEEIDSRCLSAEYHDSSVMLIPISSAQQNLARLCQLLTGLIASQMSKRLDDRFQIPNRSKISLQNGMLSAYQIKRCAAFWNCQIILTGDLREVGNKLNLNLFVWDVHKGYVVYFANIQLNDSIALTALISQNADQIEPYYLKWRDRPHLRTYYTAMTVADINGDGLNELILSDGARLDVMAYGEYGFWKRHTMSLLAFSSDAASSSEQRRVWRPKITILSADNNSNHYDELYVMARYEGTKVLEWNGKKLSKIELTGEAIHQKNFMFVARYLKQFIATPPLTGKRDYFSGEKTSIFTIEDQKISLSKAYPIPVDYHSLAFDLTDNTTEPKYVVIDQFGHLRIYQPDLLQSKQIYQSSPIFGEGIAIGDLDGNGINEIVTTFCRSDQYDKFFIVEWDNGIYTKKWGSPKLDGQITALIIHDADNDDRSELIVCVQNRSGSQILLYAASR